MAGVIYRNEMSTSSKISILFQEEEIIAKNSQSVIINPEGVNKLAKKMITWNNQQKEFDIEKKYIRYSSDFPQCYDYRSADWLFVLNTLNFPFCILQDTKQWTVNGFTGYPALCSAMKRAITEEKKLIWNPRYYVNMKIDEMKELFRGDDGTCIPRIDTRLKILHDVGRILIDEYDGTFLTCIKLCNYNAKLLMLLLTTKFKCYQDAAIYNEVEVRLNIKAKILINDLQPYFPINITTCVMIPMIFADYRSLDILFQYNVLCYNETFKETLKTCDDSVISQCHDSTKELELRSCAIAAVKLVYKEMQDDLEFLHIDELKNVEFFNISKIVDNFFFQKFHELQDTKIGPE